MSIKKAQSLIDSLESKLTLRLPTFTITKSVDAKGSMLLISADATPAAGEEVMAIRIKPMEEERVNSIGLPQESFSPSVAQVIEEAAVAFAIKTKVCIESELAKLGVAQERYSKTAGTVPTLAMFLADGTVNATLDASLSNDAKWPLSGQ